jgi:peptide deformylase
MVTPLSATGTKANELMSVLPIYLYGTDVLRKKAKPVQSLDDSTIKLMMDMAETMRKANGIGLAATQVGDLRRMLVLDISAIERGEDDGDERSEEAGKEAKILVAINPEILQEEGKLQMEEGCLSIPDLRAEVTRAEKIKVKFRDANFDEVVMEADGLLGRAFLHEIDHLNGVMFVDHLNLGRRTLLKNELRKIKNGEVDTTYPVISANEA